MRTFRAVSASLLLVALSLVAGFGLLEIGLRVTHMQPDFFFQLDPEVGAIHIPGKSGWAVFRGGKQYITINSLGYRDRERSVAKPSGTFRIALLGDSFVEAFQVPQEQTLAALLERRLNRDCAGSGPFEVLNFGVSGFGTAEELETLRHRASRFAPDLVLLNLYTSNDLYDNSSELDVEPNRLRYTLGPNNTLTLVPFSVRDNEVKRWFRAHSYAYLFVRDRIKLLTALRKALVAVSAMQDRVDDKSAQVARQALAGIQYLRSLPPSVVRAWALTEVLIDQVRAEAATESAGFGVIVTPNREEVLTRADASALADPQRDYQQSLRRIDGICASHGFACLQLADAFRGQPFDQLYFPFDGHWTSQGHALAADTTFDWMTHAGLLRCSSQAGHLAAAGHSTTASAN